MKKNELRTLALATLISLWSVQAASAGTNLDEGIKLYQSGEYTKARASFEKAIAEAPNAWQPHYYLANTYLVLGKYASAKYEYSSCQRLTTNATVQQRCKSGIEQVAKRQSNQAPGTASGAGDAETKGGASKSAKGGDGKTAEGEGSAIGKAKTPSSPAKSAADKRKEEILKKAKDECAAIKKAAKEQIENEKANSNQFVVGQDGGRTLGISEEREKEIMTEADQKCKKIMDDAERVTKMIR